LPLRRGAVDEGEFHESMNLASLWRLPVLFVYEKLYAMGMALDRAEAETDLSRKAAGYKMPGVMVDPFQAHRHCCSPTWATRDGMLGGRLTALSPVR
jgi:TPP-dependent pyruvate/acetoin dehydrogenase alpha subunit